MVLVQFLSVRLSVTSNRQTDRRKIVEGDMADGLTIRYTDRHLTFYSRIIISTIIPHIPCYWHIPNTSPIVNTTYAFSFISTVFIVSWRRLNTMCYQLSTIWDCVGDYLLLCQLKTEFPYSKNILKSRMDMKMVILFQWWSTSRLQRSYDPKMFQTCCSCFS